MAANTFQKIAVLPIDANLKTLIEAKLAEGYVLQQMAVSGNNLIIIYATPELE